MSTAPVSIITTGPADAPVAYEVPAAQEIQLSSVSAEFDGTGATGDFLPCLSLYDQHGNLLSRTFPEAVAAGDAAEVTFAPFLRGRLSSGGTSPDMLYLLAQAGATPTIPDSTDVEIVFSDIVNTIGATNPGADGKTWVFPDLAADALVQVSATVNLGFADPGATLPYPFYPRGYDLGGAGDTITVLPDTPTTYSLSGVVQANAVGVSLTLYQESGVDVAFQGASLIATFLANQS